MFTIYRKYIICIILLIINTLISSACDKNNASDSEVSTSVIPSHNISDKALEEPIGQFSDMLKELPPEVSGEWQLTRKIDAWNVGRDAPDYTNDKITIESEEISYNGKIFKNPYIANIEDTDYYNLLQVHRLNADKLGIAPKDKGTIFLIYSEDNSQGLYILYSENKMFYLGGHSVVYLMEKNVDAEKRLGSDVSKTEQSGK